MFAKGIFILLIAFIASPSFAKSVEKWELYKLTEVIRDSLSAQDHSDEEISDGYFFLQNARKQLVGSKIKNQRFIESFTWQQERYNAFLNRQGDIEKWEVYKTLNAIERALDEHTQTDRQLEASFVFMELAEEVFAQEKIPALVVFNPKAVNFDNTAIKGSSTTTVELVNIGGETASNLSFLGLGAPFGFSGGGAPGVGGNCGVLLPASTSCTISLSFQSRSQGQFNDELVVSYLNGVDWADSKLPVKGHSVAPAQLKISDFPIFDYLSVSVGGSVTQTFTLTNSGGTAASGIGGFIQDNDFHFLGGSYPGTTGDCGVSISASVSCKIVIEFSPKTSGVKSSSLNLTYFNGQTTEHLAPALDLRGEGVTGALLTISESDPYDFGLIPVNSQSSQTFIMTNTGGSTATAISGLGLTSPFTFLGGSYPGTGGTCGLSLAPAASCDFVIEFAPTSNAASSDTIQIDYNDGSIVQSSTRDLQGTSGSPGLLTISESDTFDFGSVATGSTSSHIFTITNTGSTAVNKIAETGLTPPFQFSGGSYPGTGGTCTTSLSSTDSCTIVVEYSPVFTGASSGSLTINYDDGVALQSSSRMITGTSLAPALLTISELDPFNFGTIAIGGSASRIFTVTNTGHYPATAMAEVGLASPFGYMGGTYPGTGGNCLYTIAPGASCDLVIEFLPTSTGLQTGSISISYNNGSNLQSVDRNLQGASLSPGILTLSETDPFHFGHLAAGSLTTHTFVITNTGGFPATAIAASGITAPFSFAGGTYPGVGGTCASSLVGGNSCNIVVEYAPLVSSSIDTNTIEINYDPGNGTVWTASRDIVGSASSPANLRFNSSSKIVLAPIADGSATFLKVSITNIGDYSATSIAEVGLATPFSFVGGGYPGTEGSCTTTLAPGATCEMHIGFSPTGDGKFNDSIDLSYFDGASTVNVLKEIQGEGLPTKKKIARQ